MTRFGIDADVALKLVRDGLVVADGHRLVGPNRLPSDALASVHRQFRAGDIDRPTATLQLDGITTLKIRLLGDRVSRATAFKIAERLGWDDTVRAEYLAVAVLQADALVTLDQDIADQAAGIVDVAPLEALLAP